MVEHRTIENQCAFVITVMRSDDRLETVRCVLPAGHDGWCKVPERPDDKWREADVGRRKE